MRVINISVCAKIEKAKNKAQTPLKFLYAHTHTHTINIAYVHVVHMYLVANTV